MAFHRHNIKPAVCGDEPSDVGSYKATEKEFPHQTTSDQWFDETQFEAYRMLGFHSLKKMAGDGWKGTTIDDLVSQVKSPHKKRNVPGSYDI